MGYRKINIELIVFSDEAAAVVGELNSAIDQIEKSHAIFGGEIETSPAEHSGTRRKPVLRHWIEAGNKASAGVKLAAHKVADAYHKVI
jgi:hypothetical protein